MVYHSSRSNVYHLPGCRFIARIRLDALDSFDSPVQAKRAGYRMCSCCSPVGRQLQRERRKVTVTCRDHNIFFRLYDGQLSVSTPMSKWRIVVSDLSGMLSLYHRNTRDPNETGSPVPRHHLQNVHRDSIEGYLDYIIEHDYYRMRHPLSPPPKPKSKPRKGTRRWRNQQKREKENAKNQAIRQVYALLESL